MGMGRAPLSCAFGTAFWLGHSSQHDGEIHCTRSLPIALGALPCLSFPICNLGTVPFGKMLPGEVLRGGWVCVQGARRAVPYSHVPNMSVVGNLYRLEVPTSRPSHPPAAATGLQNCMDPLGVLRRKPRDSLH